MEEMRKAMEEENSRRERKIYEKTLQQEEKLKPSSVSTAENKQPEKSILKQQRPKSSGRGFVNFAKARERAQELKVSHYRIVQ